MEAVRLKIQQTRSSEKRVRSVFIREYRHQFNLQFMYLVSDMIQNGEQAQEFVNIS